MRRVRPLALLSHVAMSLYPIAVAFAHAADETDVIGAADVLEIQVWDNKDLNQMVFVGPDGKISLPLLGEIQAGGRIVQQVQDVMADAYAKSAKGANVTVILKEIKSRPCISSAASPSPALSSSPGA